MAKLRSEYSDAFKRVIENWFGRGGEIKSWADLARKISQDRAGDSPTQGSRERSVGAVMSSLRSGSRNLTAELAEMIAEAFGENVFDLAVAVAERYVELESDRVFKLYKNNVVAGEEYIDWYSDRIRSASGGGRISIVSAQFRIEQKLEDVFREALSANAAISLVILDPTAELSQLDSGPRAAALDYYVSMGLSDMETELWRSKFPDEVKLGRFTVESICSRQFPLLPHSKYILFVAPPDPELVGGAEAWIETTTGGNGKLAPEHIATRLTESAAILLEDTLNRLLADRGGPSGK